MWRLLKETAQSSDYVSFPWKYPLSEGGISKALTAQYSSVYTCDYMGMPQERRLAPLHSRHEMQLSTNTEMRGNYREPKQKPELLGNFYHYSSSTHPNMTSGGIVPTVVQRHAQQRRSDLANYDWFCGKRITYVTDMIGFAAHGAAAVTQSFTSAGKGCYKNSLE
ncbi:hypothetical protein PBY51_009850 [Eleginops maclovinus]|uniref:Uncharacterized protein n=1 Tax=Eleginops maclovinus TaxID=56733 RepID=A0AAN8AQS2_ELEMC|nr:hypothetical protein PBY51_009850 [Eleginops maclovinus]